MARNNPKPSGKVNWDATGNIVEPNAGRKTSGWLFGVKPPAQNFNWLWNLLGLNQLYSNAQVEDWIVIDSDADEGDYATLAAYIADSPAISDRILVKEDQTVTAQVVLPDNVTLKFLDGSRLLCATNIATSVLKLGSNPIIEGVLNIILSQTGTTAKAVEIDGDNATGKINVENASTGTLTTAYHINANKTGNRINGFIQNTGGGTLTNRIIDNSTEVSNLIILFDETDNSIKTNGTAFVDLLNAQTIAGPKTFIDVLKVEESIPRIRINETGVSADSGKWVLLANGERFNFRVSNDDEDVSSEIFIVDRTGMNVDLLNILSDNLQHNGDDVVTVADSASETAEGIVELATNAEIAAGTDTVRAVTPAGLASKVSDGAYTPSSTSLENIASVDSLTATFMRIGDLVTVFFRITATPTAGAGTETNLTISIPVAVDFTSSGDLYGSGVTRDIIVGVSPFYESAIISADPSNDGADIHFKAQNTNRHLIQGSFSYQVP